MEESKTFELSALISSGKKEPKKHYLSAEIEPIAGINEYIEALTSLLQQFKQQKKSITVTGIAGDYSGFVLHLKMATEKVVLQFPDWIPETEECHVRQCKWQDIAEVVSKLIQSETVELKVGDRLICKPLGQAETDRSVRAVVTGINGDMITISRATNFGKSQQKDRTGTKEKIMEDYTLMAE